MKVMVAGDYPEHTYEKLRKALPERSFELVCVNSPEAYESMTEAEILILRIYKAREEMMERNQNLKMIMRWGAGFDSVDIEAAGKRGILVTNTPGANAGAVSELAVMLMLAVGRKLLCHAESLKGGIWSKNTFLNHSFCLNGKLVGIIGSGNIGRQVADKVRIFGAMVQYYDVFRLSEEEEKKHQMTFVSLENLLKTSDVISLHVPLTDSTYHLIGAEQVGCMKTGSIIINTARGGLVDDKAVAVAVRSGKLAGAGLDGVEREPLAADDELLRDPNIVVTPHIGGGTSDLCDVIVPMLVKDIEDYAEGKEVMHVVNRELLKA